MINFDLIQAGIYVGSCPSVDQDIAQLKQLKVSSVICLQSDEDLAVREINWPDLENKYRDNDIQIYRFPILDFDENDLANKVAEPIIKLSQLLKNREKVYVHCNSGVCRAPAVVLGYLCHEEGMSIESALSQIRISRPIASPFKSAVKKALLILAEQKK